MLIDIFGNGTFASQSTWVPNSTTRGTANIFQTCLLTLFLCIWKAVHLNLPEFGNLTFLFLQYQTWRKIGWLMVSLLAPELVVFSAWSQLARARAVRDHYNKEL